ncbi:MAG: hypothetical protein OEV43_08210 [Coriobacteriia bacterium]|nr:hypothetical protein [Coriobacteriia bacterium]
MKHSTLRILAFVVVLLGVGLLVGGIVTDKDGAVVIGIIVGGVAAQRWIAMGTQGNAGERQ